VEPTVSVVLPVRNGGACLAEAVDSIIGQSFQDLELILVDDHSDDGAIEQLAMRDERVHVLRSAGRGVSAAFNTGMRQARGAFVARMDADDIALPDRIGRQLDYLGENPGVDISGACVEFFPAGQIAGGYRRYQAWLNRCRTPQEIHRQLFIESPIPNPSALFRRDALLRLGGYSDPAWPEDYDLFLRADGLGLKMGKPEGVLLRWREHPGRLTRRDGRYSLERFQQAKAHYLCRDRLDGERPIMIWGAGPSGRLMHDLLAAEGAEIEGFLDVHPRRIGGHKRGLPVWSIDAPNPVEQSFVVVAVGAADARPKIRRHLRALGRAEGTDFLFVA
jgi:glycosyltransferase involved in cell wall biosynthesis